MKKLLLSLLFLQITFLSFAMPGFTSYINDRSGTYVYYRDYSFGRESYIGILTYDEATFQIRYYAPKNDQKFLPEKDLALLLTINPNSNFWDMTGERILSETTPTPEDFEILNYLHDILYEFSARRIKIGELTPEDKNYIWGNDFWNNGIKRIQDYEQFGGSVTIIFDCLIPLFNIKKIIAPDGSTALEACLIGDLKSNDDKSFEVFKGFTTYDLNSDSSKAKTYKKGKAIETKISNHSITVDENWEINDVDNLGICGFFMLNEDGLMVLTQYPAVSNNKLQNDFYTIHGLLSSVYYSYKNLSTCELTFDTNTGTYKIIMDSQKPKNNFENYYLQTFYLLSHNSDNTFDLCETNIYKKAYLTNRVYFDKILKTYK